MKTAKPEPFKFTRTGNYLNYTITVTQYGKLLETLPLSGVQRRLTIALLQQRIGDSRATKLVAFGQPVENETWK